MPYFRTESVQKSSNEAMVAKNVACFRVLKQLEDGGSQAILQGLFNKLCGVCV